MADSYIQVPADGAGKKVQTFNNTVNSESVHANGVHLVTSAGASTDPASGNGVAACGNVDHDAADSGSPLKMGGKAISGVPTAVAGNDRVNAWLDLYGALNVKAGGISKTISQTPTVSNAAIYAAKDAVGGKLTFANAARKTAEGGVIEAITIIDNDQQMAELDLVIFNDDITTGTDNAAYDPSNADLLKAVGVVTILAADYADLNANSLATIRGLNIPFQCVATSLYGQLVTRGTPTYASTSSITVILHLRQD